MPTHIKPPPTHRTKGEPPPEAEPSHNLAKPDPGSLKRLNFRVPAGFHLEFKMYAARHGISMLDLLQRSFTEYTRSAK